MGMSLGSVEAAGVGASTQPGFHYSRLACGGYFRYPRRTEGSGPSVLHFFGLKIDGDQCSISPCQQASLLCTPVLATWAIHSENEALLAMALPI